MELVVLRVKLPDDEEPQEPDSKPDSGEHIVKELIALDGPTCILPRLTDGADLHATLQKYNDKEGYVVRGLGMASYCSGSFARARVSVARELCPSRLLHC